MRVLLVSGEFPPLIGGVGDYTACLAAALQELGVQVAVLTSQRAEVSQGAYPFPVLAQVPRWSFPAWRQVRQGLESQASQIVHIQYQAAAYGLHPAINLLPLYLRLRAPGAKSLVTFHDLRAPYIFPKAGLLRDWAVRYLARRCHGVICAEEADILSLSRWGLRSRLVPIGSNIPVEAVWDGGTQATDSLLLGYFGLLNRSKGLETLLGACRLLRGRGLKARLVMVGADLGDSDPSNAAHAREVRALAGEPELEGAIHWTGHLSPMDTSRALKGLDLCVLPYRDGASFRRGTLMAALAHGLPLVTTAPSAPPMAGPRLADGEICRLVPAGDAEALARAIEELAAAPSLRKRLAEGALALSQAFTWDKIAKKTLEAYEEVLCSTR